MRKMNIQAKRLIAAIVLVLAVLIGAGLATIWGSWNARDTAESEKQQAVSSVATLSSVGQQVIDIAAEQQRVIQELSKLCAHQPVPRDLEPACEKASGLATQSLPTAPGVTEAIPSLTVVTVTTVHPQTVPFTVLVIGSTVITSTLPGVVVTRTIEASGATVTAVVTSPPVTVTAVVATTETHVIPTTAVLTVTEGGVVTTETVMTTETLTSTKQVPTTETTTLPLPTTETATASVTVTVTHTPETVTVTETPGTTDTATTTETQTSTETSTVIVLPSIFGGLK